jgi:hypothetical protein
MHLTKRDAVATVATAAAAGLYVLWATGTAFAGLSVRAVAVIAFALGWVGCTSAGPRMAAVYHAERASSVPIAYSVVASIVGAVALVAGVVAIVWANETVLAVLVWSTVAIWAITTARHAIADDTVGEPHGLRPPVGKAA